MKLLILLYLEDDEAVVNRLLEEKGINAFSRLPVEGHGAGIATGWYGEIAPYRSRLIFSIVPADDARAVLEAVKGTEVADNRHPVHAALVDVEAMADSGVPTPGGRA